MNWKFRYIPYYWWVENWLYNIKWWFINQWHYSKQFFYIRPWDFQCVEYFLLVFLKRLHKCMEEGHEIDETLNSKLQDIERCIQILGHRREDKYQELAEKILCLKMSNRTFEFEPCQDKPGFSQMKENRTSEEIANDSKILKLSYKLEQREWLELWDLIKDNAQGWCD